RGHVLIVLRPFPTSREFRCELGVLRLYAESGIVGFLEGVRPVISDRIWRQPCFECTAEVVILSGIMRGIPGLPLLELRLFRCRQRGIEGVGGGMVCGEPVVRLRLNCYRSVLLEPVGHVIAPVARRATDSAARAPRERPQPC